ncbi:MAG TPA: DUF5916 domain-containing protein [Kofleriaceae bacterium]|nr:DUF5916 domain-containing protein [Kofleriaceae bacterium]
MRWLPACLLFAASAARADCPHGGKVIPIARGSIRIDGKLDDATWATSCFVDDFEQKMPAYGAPPTRRMTVAVATDGDSIYIAARMWAAGPDDIDDALTQRDDTGQAERFIVSIDPSHSRRVAYSFAVTAAGVRADWIHTDDTEGARDQTWNPVWRAATQILPDGWTAELAMPLSQLRLPATPQTTWGINFNWYVPHRNEDVFWRAVPPDRTAWASWFGELVGIPVIQPKLGLEVLPYATSRLTLDESPSGALAHRRETDVTVGVDAKLRPLPGLTVAATINPDFGQVDVDPAVVNLTAYEIQLPEKRPFFIENAPLFANAGGAYFYSRRIGGLPRTLLDADEIALPTQVGILGAVTAGGFIAERTQIAALAALTDSSSADALVDGKIARLPIAPSTGWGALRLEHQTGASLIGATATVLERELTSSSLAQLLPRSAVVLGGDARLRTDDGTYDAVLYTGLSSVSGTPGAITAVETSSTHFFQRPDATSFHVDTAARRLAGWHAGAIGSKRAGTWQGSASLNLESPGFDLNDMGVLQSADDIDVAADVKRAVTTPAGRVLSWSVGAGATAGWNFGGMRKPVDLRASGDITSTAFSAASIAFDVTTPGGSDDLTRGGPIMRTGWAESVKLTASTPRGRARQLQATLTGQLSSTLQQGIAASMAASWRVVPALRLDITPQLTWTETHRQYVATLTDVGGGERTFGARYLFGYLHRKEAALELRATWSLSPDLVVTLYAQPFVSVGRYDRLGELAAGGASSVRWYEAFARAGEMRTIVDGDSMFSIDEPDFTVASLRSTAVVRWQLTPGSTLFVVWQQSRGGDAVGSEPLHTAAPDVVTRPGIHTFAIKLSYWFG